MIKLKVNGNELTVLQVYPYQYSFGEGKEVLRIKVSRDNHNYSELETQFANVTTNIEQYEDAILVNSYTGFTRDFKCNYENNEFDIEVTKVTQTELALDALMLKQEEDSINNQLAIAELAEALLGGAI